MFISENLRRDDGDTVNGNGLDIIISTLRENVFLLLIEMMVGRPTGNP